MNTLTRDGAIFNDGDIITVKFIDIDYGDKLTFKDCKLIYRETQFGSRLNKSWFILSNHRVLDGDIPRGKIDGKIDGYKYSWSLGPDGFCSREVYKIESQTPHKGKWANGSFRKKLIDRNLI